MHSSFLIQSATMVSALLLSVHGVGRAQTLAQRIDAVREGTVRLTYASRPGLCGDGKDAVQSGPVIVVFPSMFGYGRTDSGVCFTGPVRVAVGRSDGETVSLRVHVGGRWNSSDDIRDLGVVPAAEAARYFMREATRLGGRNAEYALGAAVFADSASVWPDLVRIARAEDVRSGTRQRAVFWLATYDDAGAAEAVRSLITDAALDEDVRGGAIIALARRDISAEDVAFLRRIYPTLSAKLRDNVFLAVSRSDDPSAARWLGDVATSNDETVHTRQQAMFWLGQGEAPTSALLALYDRLREPELRTHYTFVLSQRRDRQALDKLIDVAQHDADRGVRRQALFWLGQSKDPRAADFLREMVTR
jgi:hypothetical protein